MAEWRSAVTAPPSERYVTSRELAALMGVSARTIRRFTAAGMPSENWGMARTRRYLPSEAVAWARARQSHRRIEAVNPPGRRDNAVSGSIQQEAP
jgi:hypothetical protein